MVEYEFVLTYQAMRDHYLVKIEAILTLILVLIERNRMASCGAGHKREKSPYLSSSTDPIIG